MARLELVDSGILYINDNPAYKHMFASHSHPLALSEKEFVCTYQAGAGLYSVDVNVGLLRSLDGGVSWTDEGVLYDRAGDEGLFSYHDGFLSQMGDGTLVVLAFRADRSAPEKPMFSESGGLIKNEPVLFFSEDGGRTWRGPQVMALPEGLVATPTDPVIELADGSWMAVFDRWHAYEDPGPYQPQMLAFFSRDRGQTWGEQVVVSDGAAEGKGFWHGKVIRLLDDRLYAMFWAADVTKPEKGPVDLPIHYGFADETGREWSRPEATGIPGQTHWPVEVSEGRLCAVYTLRDDDRPGFMAVLSEDGGKTWDLEHQVRLWDATGWTHIGIPILDKYPRSHDTIAFGAPTLMRTPAEELYASWWCTYNSLTHIRWGRLRVRDS